MTPDITNEQKVVNILLIFLCRRPEFLERKPKPRSLLATFSFSFFDDTYEVYRIHSFFALVKR